MFNFLKKQLRCAYCGNELSTVWLWQEFEEHEACPCKVYSTDAEIIGEGVLHTIKF